MRMTLIIANLYWVLIMNLTGFLMLWCTNSCFLHDKLIFISIRKIYFGPRRAARGILVPQQGIEPAPWTVKVQIPNHWNTTESFLFLFTFYPWRNRGIEGLINLQKFTLLHRCSVLFDSLWPHGLAHQAPLSMGFSRQEYWSALPCPPPGDFPNPGTDTSPIPPFIACLDKALLLLDWQSGF